MSVSNFDPEPAALARSLGAAHLGLIALLNVAIGALLVGAGMTDRLLQVALSAAPRYVTEPTVIARWPAVQWALTDGAIAAGSILVVVGFAGLYATRLAVERRRRRVYLAVGCASALNPLVLPLVFIAVALFVLFE